MDGRIAYAGPADLVPPAIAPPGGEAVPFSEWERYDAQGAGFFPALSTCTSTGAAEPTRWTSPSKRCAASPHSRRPRHDVPFGDDDDRITGADRCSGPAVREAMALSNEDGWLGARIVGMHLGGAVHQPQASGSAKSSLYPARQRRGAGRSDGHPRRRVPPRHAGSRNRRGERGH